MLSTLIASAPLEDSQTRQPLPTMGMIRIYFSTPERPVTDAEFHELWASMRVADRIKFGQEFNARGVSSTVH